MSQRMPLFRRWRDMVDALWGYDFFISYSQPDGIEYPKRLKTALERPQQGRGFSVFVDTQDGFRAGDDLNVMARRRVRSSTHFVVVGRPRALMHSRWVPREAQLYIESQTRRASGRAPIIIDVDAALAAARAQETRFGLMERDDLDDWVRIEENLAPGQHEPSHPTVESLVHSFNGTRREKRRARLFGGLAIMLCGLATVAIGMAVVARRAQQEAEIHLAASHLNLAEALKTEGRANAASVYAAQSLSIRDGEAGRRFLMENPPATLLGIVPLAANPVSALAVSRAGRLAIGDTAGRLDVLDLGGPSPDRPIRSHQLGSAPIEAIAFSRDGERIAVSQRDGAVSLLQPDSPAAPAPVYRSDIADPEDPHLLNRIMFLADGRLAIVVNTSGGEVLQLLDVNGQRAGEPLSVAVSDSELQAAASHPDEPRLVLLYGDGGVSSVEVTPGRKPILARIRDGFPASEGGLFVVGGSGAGGGASSVVSIAYEPSTQPTRSGDAGTRFAVGLGDGSIWLLDGKGGLEKRLAFPRDSAGKFANSIIDIQFTADGRRLLALRGDATVAVFEREQEWRIERVLDSFASPDHEMRMACCIGDDGLVTVSLGRSDGERAKVWDLSAARQHWSVRIADTLVPSAAGVSSLAFDAAGRRLAVGTSMGQIVVLDTTTRSVEAISPGHHSDENVTWLAFGTGAQRDVIFSAASGRLPYRWSLDSCSEQAIVATSDAREVHVAAPDSARDALLVARLSDQDSQLVRVGRGAAATLDILTASFPGRLGHLGPGAHPAVVGYTPQNKFFYLWTPARRQVRTIALAEPIKSMVATPDGGTLLAASGERIRRWRFQDGDLIAMPDIACPPTPWTSCWASTLAIDPQARWFATTEWSDVLLRRPGDGALLARLSAHASTVDVLAISPDGGLLASGDNDGRVVVWNLSPLTAAPEHLRAEAQRAAGFRLIASGLAEMPVAMAGLKAEFAPQRRGESETLRFDSAAFDRERRPAPSCRQ